MIWPNERRQEWNDFVADSAYGDVLQCWEWGELKRETGWMPLPVGIEREGRLAAACLALRRRVPRLGLSLLYAPRGPIVDPTQEQCALELACELTRLGRESKAMVFKADPAVREADTAQVRLLERMGLRRVRSTGGFGGVQPRCVMKVDLTPSEDDLLASFSSKWRYNIRLAERKGVVVAEAADRSEMDAFHDLLLITAERDGFTVRARSYFQGIWTHLVERGLARLFMTRVGEQVVAGAIAFILGRQAWYVYGASSNTHRNLMPNHLMQWQIMRWARAAGCEVYDMRGVSPERDGEPLEPHLAGLNRFKRGFGAKYVEYTGEWQNILYPVWYALFEHAMPMFRALRARAAQSAIAESQ